MEWIGLCALALVLCYSAYPGKVNVLERKVKKLECKLKGESEMSKLFSELVGKDCIIKSGEVLELGETKIVCKILDVDEEWVKLTYEEKKKGTITKILRIDTIDSVELVEENTSENN